MHSKPKLALAILTSPTAAFEEILDRRLLGTAVFIAAIAGLLSALPVLVDGMNIGSVRLLALGKSNPFVWVGLLFLYALIMQKLLKWVGTDIDYPSLLIVMGWAQVTLSVAQLALCIAKMALATGDPNATLMRFLSSTNLAMNVWYVALIGIGIQVARGAQVSRGVLIYIAVAGAASIAFGQTYNMARFSPYTDALPGIRNLAVSIASMDMIAWAAAGTIGILWSTKKLFADLAIDANTVKRTLALLGVLGAVIVCGYVFCIVHVDYYGKLIAAQHSYDNDKYVEAASRMKALLPVANKSGSGLIQLLEIYHLPQGSAQAAPLPVQHGEAVLLLDIADTYYLAGNCDSSMSYYKKYLRIVKQAKIGKGEGVWTARAYSGIGSVYYSQGKYDAAIDEFLKATRAWPEFRDVWVRLALAYDQIQEYDKAIDAADTHALKKLDSQASVAWVALAQAYIRKNDTKQAKAAIGMVAGLDPDLAKRIGEGEANWANSVNKLTRSDLKFPLEKISVKLPEPKKTAKRK